VVACAGDVPTLEALGAVDLLGKHAPALKVRFVNVVDLLRLQSEREHPHGLSDESFDALFTVDKPVIFAYHGYPSLIHRLTYSRANHKNFHVHGFKEEGTTTTPFDMVVRNSLDRYNLVLNVVKHCPVIGDSGPILEKMMHEQLVRHRAYIIEKGEDLPEIRNWIWSR